LCSAIRARFGIHFQMIWLAAELLIDLLLMAAEIGGVAIAIKMLTGVSVPLIVPGIAVAVWLVLWLCGFTMLEYGIGLLGLVTLCFVVSAWQLGPAPGDLVRGLVPTAPHHDRIRYVFIAISIVGATISPYLLIFYSSGCIEEKMNEKELMVDRITAYAGTMFGGVVSMGVLVTSAIVLKPLGARIDSLEQAAPMLVPVFHDWAITLFALSLGIGCLGAAVEITANATFVFGQIGGWSWGLNKPRRDTARSTLAGMAVLLLGLAIALLGVDPLQLTMISVAAIVIVMPVVVLPFLVLMNDTRLVKGHTNGAVLNLILAVLVVAGAIMAIVVVPLEIKGG
jgi:Mn2+/Fe2+ NRAMP family transporter